MLALILFAFVVSGEQYWAAGDNAELNPETTIVDPATAEEYIVQDSRYTFACKICNHISKTRAHCRTHIVSRHGPDEKIPCPKCPKLLKNKFSLRAHLWTHKKQPRGLEFQQ